MRSLRSWRLRGMLLVGSVAAGVCALLLLGSGAAIAVSHPRVPAHRSPGVSAGGRAGFSPTAREVRAAALHTAYAAGHGALPIRAGAELPWLRRANADTYQAGSGRLTTRIYPTAVNYRTAHGAFAPIDTTLVARGVGLAQRANDLGVVLPRAAAGMVRVGGRTDRLEFAVPGASGAAAVSGSVERFASSGSGLALAYSSQSTGVGWQATVPAGQAGRGVSFLIHVSRGLSARLLRGMVQFRNAHGKVAWQFAAPTAHALGSDRSLPVRLSLHAVHGGVRVSVAPVSAARAQAAADFASFPLPADAGTAIPAATTNPDPVVINGQVVAGNASVLAASAQTGDCYVASGAPTTSYCLGNTNYVGPDDNTLLNFDIADDLPSDVQILQSYAVMGLASESSTTSESVGVYQAAQSWTNAATWDTYDGSDAWTTPGGDTIGPGTNPTVPGASEDTQTIGGSAEIGSDFYWDINQSMQAWVDGAVSPEDGLIFEATAGSSAPTTLGFDTETSPDNYPYIILTYDQRMGDYTGAQYDTHQLTDRSSAGVNVGTGNLLVSNSDEHMTGVDGLDLNVGRYYNNLSDDQGAFGTGWSMSPGSDTYLEIQSDEHDVVDYFDGTGNAQMYYLDNAGTAFVSPPGEDAQLTTNDMGNNYSATTFTLTFRHSGLIETFTAPANEEPKVAELYTIQDRHGNTITYTYNTSHQVTSIKDSYGQITTIAWSPEGYISQITDPTGREYQYFQNSSGQLTSYEDPAGNTTYYGYDSYGNLTQITTAQGNITKVRYDAGNTNEVTSLERLVHPTDSSGPTWTYQYAPASGTCASTPGWTQGTVSDPNLHVTTYCIDDLDRIVNTIDALGHTQSATYSAAPSPANTSSGGFPTGGTTPTGMPVTFTYSTDGGDNLDSIKQGSASPLTTTFSGYPTSGGNQYLPAASGDPQGNSLNYTYDSAGDQQTAQEPVTGIESHLTNNSDGTLATSTDPDGNETTYTYSGHNLTLITPPTGSGLDKTHITYDSAHRVASISTVSGSNGHSVAYTYDDFDRVLTSIYKNAAGTVIATITYTYDNDGNMLTRVEGSQTTTYSYDGLNRLTCVTYPSSSVSYGHDPAGNVTSLIDASGTTKYAYDKANRLTSVTDPGATVASAKMTYNNDDQLLTTTYHSGASIVNTYNPFDQLSKTTDNYKASGGASAHLSYAYTYDGTLQQTMTDQAGNVTTYTYDQLNRLQNAQTVNGTTTTAQYAYGYDSAGNLLRQSTTGTAIPNGTTSYAYNPGNQTCWSYAGLTTLTNCSSPPAGAHSYSYDNDGNQTSNGNGLTETYNALQQTTSITSAGTTTNYSYLGEGQSELVGEGTNQLANDLYGLDSETNGTSTTYYTNSTAGTHLDERTPSGTYNYLYDGDGDVVGLTNSSAQLVNQYAYDPYGNKTTNTQAVANPFGFQNGYLTVPGFYHFGQRYDNPVDARWSQEDPLNQSSDLSQANRYSFAGDNPVSNEDPSGMCLVFSCSDYNAAEGAIGVASGVGPEFGKYLTGFHEDVVGGLGEIFSETSLAFGAFTFGVEASNLRIHDPGTSAYQHCQSDRLYC